MPSLRCGGDGDCRAVSARSVKRGDRLSYYVLLVALLLLYGTEVIRRRSAMKARTMRARKTEGERTAMRELAQRFIGKECVVYTMLGEISPVQGTLTEVSEGGLLIEKKGNVQVMNLDYVVRIEERPSKAKKKRTDD